MGYKLLFLMMVLGHVLNAVDGFASGAPKDDSVCKQLLPNHHRGSVRLTSQTITSPYVISASVIKGDKNYVISVQIKSTQRRTFKGFVAQILPNSTAYDLVNNEPIGFVKPSEGVKTVGCFGEENTATHTNNFPKERATYDVIVPIYMLYRDVHVRATVVEEYDVFWSDIITSVSIPGDLKTNSKTDPAIEWVQMTTNTAQHMAKGNELWKEDIKNRLQLGFHKLVDTNGFLKTKFIKKYLPLENKFHHGNKEDKTRGRGMYRSEKDPYGEHYTFNQSAAELLKGDVRFAVNVEHHLHQYFA